MNLIGAQYAGGPKGGQFVSLVNQLVAVIKTSREGGKKAPGSRQLYSCIVKGSFFPGNCKRKGWEVKKKV